MNKGEPLPWFRTKRAQNMTIGQVGMWSSAVDCLPMFLLEAPGQDTLVTNDTFASVREEKWTEYDLPFFRFKQFSDISVRVDFYWLFN